MAAATLPALAGPVYNNGPVLTGTSDVYYLWYGNWALDAPAQTILTNLVTDLSGSSYFNINSTYNTPTSTVSTTLAMSGNVFINGSTNANLYSTYGNHLNGNLDSPFTTIINGAISNNLLPNDPKGIYYVLTAPDIVVDGFNSGNIQFCGWHSSTNWGTNVLGRQFGFIGDPASNGVCQVPLQHPGATDFGADAMASVIAHELSETVTDPTGRAWWDSNINSLTNGNENADMCAWQFGATHTTASGGKANVTLNGHDYLLQENWINTGRGTGTCALSYGQSVSTVPEPASLALMGIALAGLAANRRRKQ
jgi:hypothetical protein